MGIEKRKNGRVRYVHKVRVDGKVTTKCLGVGEKGRLAHEAILARREQMKAEAFADAMFALCEKTTRAIVEQTFICQDMVCRYYVWRPIESLRKPLTDAEKQHIAKIKADAISMRKDFGVLQNEKSI